MKKIISLIFLLLTIGGVGSYAQTDSVKVRLKTSNAAEISLDGELSSTNILTKKVPVGKHEVVVKYGYKYSRTYNIDVTLNGNAEFEFPVEGKLSLTSTPSNSDVTIDGLPMGKTPMELNILGRHNIQVMGNKDLYHPYSTTLEVMPEQTLEHNAILHKRPPKLYGFVLANYMFSANALGIMGGLGRRFGVYAKVNVGLNGSPQYDEFITQNTNISSDNYKKKPKYIGVNAGLMLHLIPSLFVYAGSGYGEYTHGIYDGMINTHHNVHEHKQINVYHVEGAELDLGVMFKYKALLLQAGYKRILAKGDGGSFGDFNIGVGITIHKEKKR